MEVSQKEIVLYISRDNKIPFLEWLHSLRSEDRSAVEIRLDRVQKGNFGDSKPEGEGVIELRFHPGKGMRIYYGIMGTRVVVLLAGGDKSTQDKDIQRAKSYWKDCKERGNSALRSMGTDIP
jgi:putative addiction module killer protein